MPRIADRSLALPSEVSADAEEAAAVMVAFDVETAGAPLPFHAVLLRSESAASSQIEQLTASARKIAEAELTGVGTDHAVQIVANTRAMRAALDLADALDLGAVLRMHAVLMERTDPDIAGKWREEQVWIGGRPSWGPGSPHDADFVPPVAQDVPGAMADLMDFIARDDLPVLVQAAIAHAHFETIHPFADGNGRTGRALLHAILRAKGLVKSIAVPISAGLLTDTSGYVAALTAYRAGEVGRIVGSVARASLAGVDNGRLLLEELAGVERTWESALADVRSDSGARRLAKALLARPVVSAPVARELLGGVSNVHRHIDVLVERGILVGHTDYKTRNQSWRAPAVLEALDRYARRGGRRG